MAGLDTGQPPSGYRSHQKVAEENLNASIPRLAGTSHTRRRSQDNGGGVIASARLAGTKVQLLRWRYKGGGSTFENRT
jgi:hypothetical protein